MLIAFSYYTILLSLANFVGIVIGFSSVCKIRLRRLLLAASLSFESKKVLVAAKHAFGGLNYFCIRETEFFIENRSRGAGAKTIHANDFPRKSNIMFPAQLDTRFNGDAGSDCGRQNAVTIFLRLAVKNFPAGK